MATRQHPPFAAEESSTFELVANPRRRHVLAYLRDRREESVHIDDITSQVVARELMESDCVDPESVAVTLHHVHLPKLSDAGLIDYDTTSNVVHPVSEGAVEIEWPDDPSTLYEESSA